MDYRFVAQHSREFFTTQRVHLEKLEAFLLTLISNNGITKSKLDELKESDKVNLSGHKDFEAIASLAPDEQKNGRFYTIVFRDKNKAMEVGIFLCVEESRINFFSVRMIRFKYGCSGVFVVRTDAIEDDEVIKVEHTQLVEAVGVFINSCKHG